MPETKKRNPTKVLSMRYLILGTFCLLLSYSVFDREKPIDLKRVQQINNPYPGQDLVLKITLDRKKVCYTKGTYTIFDSTGTKFPATGVEYDVVGEVGMDSYSIRLPIDPDAEPGKGFVRFVTKWVCNYVHIAWPIIEVNDVPIEIFANPRKL